MTLLDFQPPPALDKNDEYYDNGDKGGNHDKPFPVACRRVQIAQELVFIAHQKTCSSNLGRMRLMSRASASFGFQPTTAKTKTGESRSRTLRDRSVRLRRGVVTGREREDSRGMTNEGWGRRAGHARPPPPTHAMCTWGRRRGRHPGTPVPPPARDRRACGASY